VYIETVTFGYEWYEHLCRIYVVNLVGAYWNCNSWYACGVYLWTSV